jgi:TPR repeat protein
MSLLPRFALMRNRTNEAALEKRVTALQSALAQCKGIARSWQGVHYKSMAVVGVICLALGFTAGVYREPLLQPAVAVGRSVGLVSVAPSVEAAQAAYQKNNYAAALSMVRPLADAGDARAQALLGQMYYRGRGVPQDDRDAAVWFRHAADQNDATAQFYLGGMYAEGRGVPQDFAESAKWYERAAEQGDGQAQYNLGLAYARGEGVAPDSVKAHMWFNLSASRLNDPRGRTAAIKNRDQVAGEMTADQISEAQKLAKDWKPK